MAGGTRLPDPAAASLVLKLHLEEVELSELLGSLHELYRAAADDRGLGFIMDAPGPCSVRLDRHRVSQAVANLLDNAFAYASRGCCVTLTGGRRGDGVRIAVCDTGPGLSEEDLGKIWRRFSRGSAASASTPGLGLGLALVHAIAHAHGGHAGGGNVEGGGAEFWIDLPAGEPAGGAS